jgi:hypothetical protein
MRIVLGVLGLALVGYGAVLLLDNPGPTLLRIAVWAAAGVLLHDFVFAPLVTALGYAGRRILPRSWWAPFAVAALVSTTLVLLAIPVFSRPGMRPDNPSVLDRDYPLGLTIALAVVWLCVPIYLLLRRLPIRQDEVVERQGADDVERQPPPV